MATGDRFRYDHEAISHDSGRLVRSQWNSVCIEVGTVGVTGKVIRENDQVRIRVEAPDRTKVVD
jgi:hypothetical protein